MCNRYLGLEGSATGLKPNMNAGLFITICEFEHPDVAIPSRISRVTYQLMHILEHGLPA